MSRVVVVGGDAAGMTSASAVHRLLPDVEVVVLERGHHSSYSACGVPYWVAGEIDGPDGLVARSPEEHRERGIDVRLGSEVLAVDVDAHEVRYRDLAGEHTLGYDRLVVATGAGSIRPDLPGVHAPGVMSVKDLVDGQQVIDRIHAGARRAVVVGSGYIGIEMAEACLARGLDVTVVERESTPLPIVEDEIGEVIADAMREKGAHMVTEAAVTGFDVGDDGAVTAVRTDEDTFPADLVVAAFGVVPRSELLADVADLGVKDGIVTDDQQRVLAPDGLARRRRVVGGRLRRHPRPAHVDPDPPAARHARQQAGHGRGRVGRGVARRRLVGTGLPGCRADRDHEVLRPRDRPRRPRPRPGRRRGPGDRERRRRDDDGGRLLPRRGAHDPLGPSPSGAPVGCSACSSSVAGERCASTPPPWPCGRG
ncbi:MAG: FAD-dependent oxidoreductase [Aeromicrobium erythreum]